MYRGAVSGQYIGFAAVSAFSGMRLTGLSGFLSGYKSIDGGAQAGISGNIVETAFGQYICNLYDFDLNGRNISFLFTGASGMIPVEKTVTTDFNVSGRLVTTSGQTFPASGVNVVVPTASISGVVANSGLFVTVPIASISGVNAVVPISTLSGVVAASGIFANVPIASVSGITVVVPPATISGVFTNVPIATISGTTVVVPPATISGVTVSLASGTVFLASGSVTSGVISSGIFVTATASVGSGQVFLASGHGFFISGQLFLASGALSGQ